MASEESSPISVCGLPLLNERPVANKWMASNILVLPLPFSPQNKFNLGQGARVAVSIFLIDVILSRVISLMVLPGK
jgi:hypothetical protein